MTKQKQLKSITFERPGAPVLIALSIHCGSEFDPEGRSGLAHFLEHILVSGTSSFPSKTALSSHVEDMGGSIGAFTDYESVTIYLEIGDPADTEEGVRILSEMYAQSLFNEQTIQNERGAILSELRMKKSKADQMAVAMLHSIMYKGTPLERFVLGSAEEIERISLQDLVMHHKEALGRAPKILVAAGGVSAKEIARLTEKYFKSYEEKSHIQTNGLKTIPDTVSSIPFSGMDEVAIAVGFHAPGILSSDAPSLLLAAQILGGGRSALLTQTLRYENGLVYSVNADYNQGSTIGEFNIRTSAKPTEVWQVIDLIKSVIEKLKKGEISEEDFTAAKKHYVKSRKVRMQTSRSWVFNHVFGLLCDSDYQIEQEDMKVGKLSRSQFLQIISTYLKNDHMFISLAGGVDKIPEKSL